MPAKITMTPQTIEKMMQHFGLPASVIFFLIRCMFHKVLSVQVTSHRHTQRFLTVCNRDSVCLYIRFPWHCCEWSLHLTASNLSPSFFAFKFPTWLLSRHSLMATHSQPRHFAVYFIFILLNIAGERKVTGSEAGLSCDHLASLQWPEVVILFIAYIR